jgi:Flp pilus assembly pilin Flp
MKQTVRQHVHSKQAGASIIEAVILLMLIALVAIAALPRLTHAIEVKFLEVEMALSAGGSTRTGGTDFCADNPRHINCLGDLSVAGPR